MNNLTYNGRKIVTDFDPKPIPNRRFDWTATFDGYDGSDGSQEPIGTGATEKEAVSELIEQVEGTTCPHETAFLRQLASVRTLTLAAILAFAAFVGYGCYVSGYENARDEIQQQKEHGL